MKPGRHWAGLCLARAASWAALGLAVGCAGAGAAGPAAGFRPADGAVEWSGLPAESLAEMKGWDQPQLAAAFPIYVAAAGNGSLPPVTGTYSVAAGSVIFRPRFSLGAGMSFRALYRKPATDPGTATEILVREFSVPAKPPAPPTVVEHVYPSADLLPENQLKFYIHFSGPMSRGEAYRNIRLLRADGRAVDLPFLELDEELWDPEMRRFTIFFDPGRIKRGLTPREEVGPALEEGKSYTLVIDAGWTDADGNRLKAAYRKAFRVGPPDDSPPNPKTWTIIPPIAGMREPLTVVFPKPMDHAMLLRVCEVLDARGAKVPAAAATAERETRLQFVPDSPWPAGDYALAVRATLEDLAGNSIGKPFEVDLFHPVKRKTEVETVKLPFTVRPK